MKKKLILAAGSLIISGLLYAQRTENFELKPAESKVSKSLYNQIIYRDTRNDTANYGIVQIGPLNAKARVTIKEPMQTQMQRLLNAAIDSDAGKGNLLFVVRRFVFREVTKATSETGYFHVRATLFAESDGRYRLLNDLDTVIEVRALDVTQKLLRNASKIIGEFISTHLQASPADLQSVTYDEALDIDNQRKMQLPLYTSSTYKDGLYASYQEFKMQQPSITAFKPAYKGDKLKNVSVTDETGKDKKVDEDEIFAVVIDGHPFVSTRYGYYPLEKKENDFFYTGKLKSYDAGAATAGALMFGLAGALLAGSSTDIANFKLDYVHGSFLYAGK